MRASEGKERGETPQEEVPSHHCRAPPTAGARGAAPAGSVGARTSAGAGDATGLRLERGDGVACAARGAGLQSRGGGAAARGAGPQPGNRPSARGRAGA